MHGEWPPESEHAVGRQSEVVAQIASRLFAQVSHDLATAVSALRGYIKLVVEGRAGPVNPLQQEYLTIALESAERLCVQAKRMSRIPDFIDQLHAEVFDLLEEWAAAVRARRDTLLEREVRIAQRLPVGRLLVAGGRKELRQVLERVLDLFLESVERGGEIVAEFSCSDREVLVRICVSGDAVPTMTDLSTVRNTVAFHGGNLSLEPQLSAGAVCIIRLPEAS